LVLTSPPPPAGELERYYPSGYHASPRGQRFPKAIELLQKILYGIRVKRAERLLGELSSGLSAAASGRKRSVLDIGCGPGFLLQRFQQSGWNVQGTELSERSAAHARERLGLPVHVGDLASAQWPAASFDAVVLWHVLEHLPRPQSTIAEAERILRPGGVLLVAVPNFGRCEARLARDKWFHLDVPRHLNHFTVPILREMLANAGLRVRSCSYLALEYDSFSLVQSTLNGLRLRHNLLYQLLRQGRKKVLKEERPFQILASLLLATPLTAASIPLTLLAALLHQGSTVTLYAQKPEQRGA